MDCKYLLNTSSVWLDDSDDERDTVNEAVRTVNIFRIISDDIVDTVRSPRKVTRKNKKSVQKVKGNSVRNNKQWTHPKITSNAKRDWPKRS